MQCLQKTDNCENIWSRGCKKDVVFPGRLIIDIFCAWAYLIRGTDRWGLAASYIKSCGCSCPMLGTKMSLKLKILLR